MLPAGGIVLQGLSSLSMNFQAGQCILAPVNRPGDAAHSLGRVPQLWEGPTRGGFHPPLKGSPAQQVLQRSTEATIKGSLLVSTGTDHTQFNNWKYGRLKTSCLNLFQSRKVKICHQLVKISFLLLLLFSFVRKKKFKKRGIK